jgi:probable rRNA maturation factor
MTATRLLDTIEYLHYNFCAGPEVGDTYLAMRISLPISKKGLIYPHGCHYSNLRDYFMQEHSPIELYVTLSNEQQNAQVEKILAAINLDSVVFYTLEAAHIVQPVMLTLLITDDAGIRDMNKQYREQDKATDVLSFPLLEHPIVEAPDDQLWPPPVDEEGKTTSSESNTTFITPPGMITNLGDIVISWPTILTQAQTAGHDYRIELLYLFSHGILHLIGYDDQTEAGYQAMVTIQQAVLKKLGQKAYLQ